MSPGTHTAAAALPVKFTRAHADNLVGGLPAILFASAIRSVEGEPGSARIKGNTGVDVFARAAQHQAVALPETPDAAGHAGINETDAFSASNRPRRCES